MGWPGSVTWRDLPFAKRIHWLRSELMRFLALGVTVEGLAAWRPNVTNRRSKARTANRNE